MLAALRLSARQLFHFALLGPASIVAGLQRMFRLALLPRGALGFFAFFPAQCCCIGHFDFVLSDKDWVIKKFCNWEIAGREGFFERYRKQAFKITQLPNYSIPQSASGFLQLPILLHQLLQPEPWELYRNLGVFPISFSLVDGSLTIFWMPDFLARPEAALAFGLFDNGLRQVELLPPRGKEFRNIVDGVVALAGIGRLGAFGPLADPCRALIFVFVGVVGRGVLVALARGPVCAGCAWPRPLRRIRTHPCPPLRSANFLDQVRRDFFEKTRRHARFGQIGAISAAIDCTAQDESIHCARHADVAQPPLFLNVVHLQQRARMRE